MTSKLPWLISAQYLYHVVNHLSSLRDLPSPTGQKKGLSTPDDKHHEPPYPPGSLSLPPDIVSNRDEDIKSTWDRTTLKPHNFTMKSFY